MTDLSQREKDFLIEKLQKDEQLPDDFKYKLFPTKHKEYELVYAGKMRKEDILADEDGVTAAPLQIERTYNGNRESFADGWKNMIVFGDNLQFLKTIYKNEDPLIKNKVKDRVKLIYIDPPFATESDFNGSEGQKAYSDKTKDSEFVEFIRKRLIVAKEILHKEGVIIIHLDYKKVHYIKTVADEIFGENNFKNEIIWQRSDPHNDAKKKFGNIHDTILIYSKSEYFKYNWEDITIDLSDAAVKEYSYMSHHGEIKKAISPLPEGARYVKLERASWKGNNPDKIFEWRGVKLKPGLQWMGTYDEMESWLDDGTLFLPKFPKGAQRCKVMFLDKRQDEGQVVQDIWQDVGRMKGGKGLYPTQKPEGLLERFILAFTDENDIVLDFFMGSGTTCAVSEKLNRKWIGCDIGKYSFFTVQKRMLTIQESKNLKGKNKLYKKPSKAFHTINTGIYDIEKLFNLKHNEYENFVLDLFEVTPKSKKISGIEFQGERKDGYDVLIWKYWEHKDAAVDEDYLLILHKNIGKKVGDRIYLIAPANSVQFIDDYYEIGNVRYYFLKVPYQIIQELHKEKFKKFRQPKSSNNVNSLENAVGFHFIRQPEVKSLFKDGVIFIEQFKAYYPDEETLEDIPGLEALAMVVVDKNYNGNEFLMSDVFFATDIIDEKGQAHISIENYGAKVSAVYIDIYGNEFREVFTTKNGKG
ncbi:site-specific DNA-methyltransferase [Salegentibacter sp. LM13S]|uniref:site-specific DNA-methyltransferase n=1 Tax=Salegentibacter lacus TaxID=2873599 RepID=UPI001CD02EBD|nr:site-specific DNA-methyltransferase [Salegentibacter lacus]MBZ9630980.1 site-specific DNA-methyltransferase [Salegentibacter lacus]